MEKRNLGLNFDLRLKKIQSLNPSFDLARVAIAYHGANRNRSIISKSVFEKAIPSIYNIPLVGRYIPDEEDFGSHDVIVTTDEDGEFSVENATVPYGVVPESCDVAWEPITEEDGTINEYLCVNVVLWKRSYGYETLISQDKWSQSMEIEVNDYSVNKDGVMTINEMIFTALCILGRDIEPCFESASVQLCKEDSEQNFSAQFSCMIDDFKELVRQTIKFEFDESLREGGEENLKMTVEERDSILAEFGVSADSIEFDYSEMTVEEFRAMFEKPADEPTDEPAGEPANEPEAESKTESEEPAAESENEPEVFEHTESFSATYMERYEAISNALVPDIVRVENKVISETYYWLCDFDDEFAYVEKRVYANGDSNSEKGRFAYVINDVNEVTLGAYEQMIVKWLTLEEASKLDDDRDELKALRQFKADRLMADHKAEIDAIIDTEFSETKKTEEFGKIKDSIYELSAEDAREKLFAIRGRHLIMDDSKSENANSRIPLENASTHKSTSKYGDLFATYAK